MIDLLIHRHISTRVIFIRAVTDLTIKSIQQCCCASLTRRRMVHTTTTKVRLFILDQMGFSSATKTQSLADV